MADILVRGLLNTLLGMGTVFVVLIFISFLISLMKYIPGLVEKFSGKKKAEEIVQVPAPVALVAEEEEPEELADDQELAAVIMAAICASANIASVDKLVVRSIKRVKRS